MSLQVGELVAVLGLDDRPLADGTDRALERMARATGAAATDAGRDAGRKLAQGVDSADLRIDADRLLDDGQVVSAGRSAGRKLSDGVDDGLTPLDPDRVKPDSADLDLAGLAMGAAIGAAIFAGVQEALDQGAGSDKLAAQLGLTPEQSAEAGRIAGRLFAGAYGESMGEVNAGVGAVISTLSDLGTTGEESIERVTTKALDFAAAFDQDVTAAVSTAGTMIRAGLAADADEAFDLMTRGMQEVPAAMRDELIPILDEYGTHFAQAGFDGQAAMSMLAEAAQGGSFELDKTADAIKEMGIQVSDLGGTAGPALEGLGLDAQGMADRFLAGGESAQAALGEIVDGLLGVASPSEQAAAAVAIFGTPIEDLAKGNIPDFLARLDDMGTGLDGVAGAADRMGDTLNDNAKASIESLTRGAMVEMVGMLNGSVVPAITGVAGVIRPLVESFQALPAPLQAAIGLGIALKAGWEPMVGVARNLKASMEGVASSTVTAASAGTAAFAAWSAYTGMMAQATAEGEAFVALQREKILQSANLTDAVAMSEAGYRGADEAARELGEGIDGIFSIDAERAAAVARAGFFDLTVEMEHAAFYADQISERYGISADSATAWVQEQQRLGNTFPDVAAAMTAYSVEMVENNGLTHVQVEATQDAADAAAEYEASLDQLKSAIEALVGDQINLVDATIAAEDGYLSLAETLLANGATLNINTEAGRGNLSAINDQVEAVIALAQAMVDETGDVFAASDVLSSHRDRLIDVMVQTGLTEAQASDYIDTLGLVPNSVLTLVTADTSQASGALARLQEQYAHLFPEGVTGMVGPVPIAGGGSRSAGFLGSATASGASRMVSDLGRPSRSAAGTAPGARPGGVGGGGAAPLVVHTHLLVDGRELARNVTTHQIRLAGE